jgi:hypothetical protein
MEACKDKAPDLRNMPANMVIDATEMNNGKFSIAEIIDSSYFIPLETTDEILIKKIDKIVFDDDKIFVLDREGNNKILVFNRQGKFMYSVGKVGQGPGEHIEACDFCLNPQDKMIYMICTRKRIMQYKYNGDFVKQTISKFNTNKLEYFNNHFYFSGYAMDFFQVVITDTAWNIVDKFFSSGDWGYNALALEHPIQKTDSLIYSFDYLDDNIYGIKNISEIFVQYRIDFGKTKLDIPVPSIKNYTWNDLSNKIYSSTRGAIRYWIQNSDYFICYYFDKKSFSMTVYNKHKNISHNYHYGDVTDRYIVQEGQTGIKTGIFEYVTDTDELVAVVQPADLLQNMESLQNEDDKNYIKSLKLTEDMNPLLYIVKTK